MPAGALVAAARAKNKPNNLVIIVLPPRPDALPPDGGCYMREAPGPPLCGLGKQCSAGGYGFRRTPSFQILAHMEQKSRRQVAAEGRGSEAKLAAKREREVGVARKAGVEGNPDQGIRPVGDSLHRGPEPTPVEVSVDRQTDLAAEHARQMEGRGAHLSGNLDQGEGFGEPGIQDHPDSVRYALVVRPCTVATWTQGFRSPHSSRLDDNSQKADAQFFHLDGIGLTQTEKPPHPVMEHDGPAIIEDLVRREGLETAGPSPGAHRFADKAEVEPERGAIVAAGRGMADLVGIARIEEDHVIPVHQKPAPSEVLDEDAPPDEDHLGGSDNLLASRPGTGRPAMDVLHDDARAPEEPSTAQRMRHVRWCLLESLAGGDWIQGRREAPGSAP